MNTESKVAGIILGGIAVALILIPVLGSQTTIFLTNGSGTGGPVSCLDNGELVLAQNLTDLCDVTILSPLTNQIIKYNGSQWINVNQTVIAGESTTCGNVGAGVILCKGGNVQIKSLVAQTGIQITNDSNTVYIMNTGLISASCSNGISCAGTNPLNVNGSSLQGQETTSCNDSGSGEATLCNGDNVNIKSLKQGSNIQLTNNPTNVTIAVTGITSENTNCNNVGTGTVIHVTGSNCNAKSLTAGGGILITNTTNEINIASTVSGESTVCTNDGHGAGNVCNGGNVHLKGIASGASVSVTMNGTDIIITNSAPESTVCTSAGGTTLIKSSSGGNCDFKGLTTSQGITVTSNTNDNNIKTNFANGTGIQITGATTQTFTNTLPENTVCTNKGSFGSDGHGICFDSAVTLRRLLAGSGITISNSTNSITITNGSPENTVCTNRSTFLANGHGLCFDNSVALRRLLQANNGITLSNDTNSIYIGNAYTCTSAGGTTLIKTSTTGVNCDLKGLTAGTGISVTSNTNDNAIGNTGVISNSCSGGITCSGTNPSTFTVVWDKLCQTTLGSSNATIVCTFTAKTHLLITMALKSTGGTGVEPALRFNTDAGANYAWRSSANGAADTTATGSTRCNLGTNAGLSPSTDTISSTVFIDNFSASRKVGFGTKAVGSDTSSATSPGRAEVACKWDNTSAQIKTVYVISFSGTGSYNTGSVLTVWGYD